VGLDVGALMEQFLKPVGHGAVVWNMTSVGIRVAREKFGCEGHAYKERGHGRARGKCADSRKWAQKNAAVAGCV
jgi:hypothetical protein